jgi:hypothetical protein
MPLLVLCLAILSSCATLRELDSRTPGRAAQDPGVKALRARLVEGANAMLGKTRLEVRGKSFTWDCSGTVRAIYWYAGIDLARDFVRYSGNGVARIFASLDAKRLLYTTRYPLSGDLIFWDNTYDMNGDGIWNDSLTHVGMVVSTAGDGTISYVHHHLRRGIVIEYMNLFEPSVDQKDVWGRIVTLNSPMRLVEPGASRPRLWLSGQLYRIMGMGYLF